jgi:hypothetical protein
MSINAVALLLRKFGTKIPGGGYEVEIAYEEVAALSRFGQIQEVPNLDAKTVKWQYFPNPTIEGVGGITPDDVTPESVTPEDAYLQERMTPEQKAAYLKHLQSAEADDGATT